MGMLAVGIKDDKLDELTKLMNSFDMTPKIARGCLLTDTPLMADGYA